MLSPDQGRRATRTVDQVPEPKSPSAPPPAIVSTVAAPGLGEAPGVEQLLTQFIPKAMKAAFSVNGTQRVEDLAKRNPMGVIRLYINEYAKLVQAQSPTMPPGESRVGNEAFENHFLELVKNLQTRAPDLLKDAYVKLIASQKAAFEMGCRVSQYAPSMVGKFPHLWSPKAIAFRAIASLATMSAKWVTNDTVPDSYVRVMNRMADGLSSDKRSLFFGFACLVLSTRLGDVGITTKSSGQ